MYSFFVRDGTVRDAQSRGKATRSRGTDIRGCTPVIAQERVWIGSYTDVRANDGRGGWASFGPDPGVRTRVPHIKPGHVSHHASVGRPR